MSALVGKLLYDWETPAKHRLDQGVEAMALAAGVADKQRLSLTLVLWVYALAIVAVGSLPRLPSLSAWIWPGAMIVGAAFWLPARTRFLLLAATLGAGWGLWHNHRALEQRLPPTLHGSDFLLEVKVVSLPGMRSAQSYFDDPGVSTNLHFSVRVLHVRGRDPSPTLRGQLLDLTWYGVDNAVLSRLRAGSRWLLPVRLKRPRGTANPHAFDYEGWLLQRGVYATGYVRTHDYPPQYLGRGFGLPALRHWLRDCLTSNVETRGELLSALLLGDRSGVGEGDQRLLRETGTAHLLAISGLHVGMVSGFFLLLGRLLGRAIGLYTGVAPRGIPLIFALAASLVYTLLAGAPLSAQRALAMTWVLLFTWYWRRRIGTGFSYALALALVLTLQPLAFYGAGFWLSFVAVGALLLGFSGRLRLPGRRRGELHLAGSAPGLLRSQWRVIVALLLPSLVFFYGFSPGGMLLNLVAIPWLGFLVLPWLMLGALSMNSAPGVWCMDFAAWQLDLLMRFLELGRDLLPSWLILGPPTSLPLLVLAALGALLVLFPAGLPGRWLGWLFLLPPLLPFLPQMDPEEELRVTVLDVGQGLAVVLRTPGQRLLYDTGPLSSSGWSAGSGIVVPYLLGEGVGVLDTLVVSHGDRDHAGGFTGVVDLLPPRQLIAPGRLAQRLRGKAGLDAFRCVAGEAEVLGDLRLRWLWPGPGDISGEENDHSCVALVEWQSVRILLAGDITSGVERQLSVAYPDLMPVDLLLAPHHGSSTSSSEALINWARPRQVVFSAGYRHHFGHPHPDVIRRYSASGAVLFNTAESGALEFTWRRGERYPEVEEARGAARFWYADHREETDAERRLSRRVQLW